MCKIFVLTNTNKLTTKQLENLIEKVSIPVTDNMSDGFGLAYSTENSFYAERWVSPNDFLMRKATVGPNDDALMLPPLMDAFGEKTKASGGLLMHGRQSTNNVSLENTHPFINDRYALIHNGVVHNEGDAVLRLTDNDTEFLLIKYSQGGMERVSESLSGYYACGMLDAENGNTIIFRDATARLYVAWFEKFETYVFATTKSIIIAAANSLGVKKFNVREAAENFHAVFDQNGKLLESTGFTPKLRSFGALDKQSLGVEFDWTHYEQDVPVYRQDESIMQIVNERGMPISEIAYDMLNNAEQMKCSFIRNGQLVA